jgi:hypothetical protein
MELREWRYMNPPATSPSGYKKRFEKLIKYHIDHASSELESITKKDIKDNGFRLSEHYDNGHHEFDRDIIASYDKASDTFMLRIFIDGKEVDNILRKGYEDFVDAAEDYMFLPDYNTPEYDDLLTESANSSIADDFKTYENLWEGTEEKEYYKVLGRTKYNLFNDSDLDAYLTQSAKLMRKPAESQKSMEEYKLNKIKFLLYNLKGTGAPVELIQKVQAVKSELEDKLN